MKQKTKKFQKVKAALNLSKKQSPKAKTPNKVSRLMQKTIETSIIKRKRGKKPKILNVLEQLKNDQPKSHEKDLNIKAEQDPLKLDWTPIFKTIIVSRDAKGNINEDYSGRKTMSSERKNSDLSQSNDIGIINQKENPIIWAQGIENIPYNEAPIEDKPNFPIRF